jgi:hypothetical protein
VPKGAPGLQQVVLQEAIDAIRQGFSHGVHLELTRATVCGGGVGEDLPRLYATIGTVGPFAAMEKVWGWYMEPSPCSW